MPADMEDRPAISVLQRVQPPGPPLRATSRPWARLVTNQQLGVGVGLPGTWLPQCDPGAAERHRNVHGQPISKTDFIVVFIHAIGGTDTIAVPSTEGGTLKCPQSQPSGLTWPTGFFYCPNSRFRLGGRGGTEPGTGTLRPSHLPMPTSFQSELNDFRKLRCRSAAPGSHWGNQVPGNPAPTPSCWFVASLAQGFSIKQY